MQSDCGRDIIHVKLVTPLLHILLAAEILTLRLTVDAIPSQQFAALVRIRLTANDRPTIAGRQMFDRLKGKANKVGMASNRHSVVGGPERVGRVLNNLDVVLLADSIEFTDIGRVTTPMNGEYGSGFRL